MKGLGENPFIQWKMYNKKSGVNSIISLNETQKERRWRMKAKVHSCTEF